MERWTSPDDPVRESREGDVAVRTVRGVPSWAAEYALQGLGIVTRYRCTSCCWVIAILARD